MLFSILFLHNNFLKFSSYFFFVKESNNRKRLTMLRLFQSLSARSRSALSPNKTAYRGYNYQTEIYTNKFQSDLELRESLKNEIVSQGHLKNAQPNLYRFIEAYRQHGHRLGHINPLELADTTNSGDKLFELNPAYYGLHKDSDTFATDGLLFNTGESMTIEQIEQYLQDMYASKMTIEFDFIKNEEEKHWIAKHFEAVQHASLETSDKCEILKLLLKSQVKFFK